MSLGNAVLLLIWCPSLWVFALRPAESGGVLSMTANGWFQIGFYLPGDLLTDQASWNLHDPCVQRGENISRSRSATIERSLYRLTGVDEKHEMRWTEYAIAMLLFSGRLDGHSCI